MGVVLSVNDSEKDRRPGERPPRTMCVWTDSFVFMYMVLFGGLDFILYMEGRK